MTENRIKLDTPEALTKATKLHGIYKRCPKCNGMLVHSTGGTVCNKCGWTPQDAEATWKHWT